MRRWTVEQAPIAALAWFGILFQVFLPFISGVKSQKLESVVVLWAGATMAGFFVGGVYLLVGVLHLRALNPSVLETAGKGKIQLTSNLPRKIYRGILVLGGLLFVAGGLSLFFQPGAVVAHPYLAGLYCTDQLDHTQLIQTFVRLLSLLVLGLIILSAMLATVSGWNASSLSIEQAFARWNGLRLSLRLASLFFVVVVLEFYFLIHLAWIVAQRSPEASPSMAYAVFSGLVYSCLIATIFVPPAVRLDRRIRHHMAEVASKEAKFDRDRWLSIYSATRTPKQDIATLTTLVLPALVGVLTKWMAP